MKIVGSWYGSWKILQVFSEPESTRAGANFGYHGEAIYVKYAQGEMSTSSQSFLWRATTGRCWPWPVIFKVLDYPGF
jgi:hypothetical protein